LSLINKARRANLKAEKAGLVKNGYDWVCSSATNYEEMESVIEVDIIACRFITFN